MGVEIGAAGGVGLPVASRPGVAAAFAASGGGAWHLANAGYGHRPTGAGLATITPYCPNRVIIRAVMARVV